MVCLGNKIVLLLLRLHTSTAFQTLLLTMKATSFFLWNSYPHYEIQWLSELNSLILVHFRSLISKMSIFTLAISCLTTSNLIHGPNLPGFYAVLLFTASDFTSITVTLTTGCCFCFGSISSFFLELFLHSSPVTYWALTDLCSSSFSVLSFCLFILFMAFSCKNTEMVCHSLLQWAMFGQNSPP